jgi:hypothetical protein
MKNHVPEIADCEVSQASENESGHRSTISKPER